MDPAVQRYTRSLTDTPHLGQLKTQAKELLKAIHAKEPDALAALHFHERRPNPENMKLADAQRILARAYGFPSWARLKHFVEAGIIQATHERAIRRVQPCDYFLRTQRGKDYWDLVCAAIRNDVATIDAKLGQNANLARLEFWYTSPIFFAVREGHLDAVKRFWQCFSHKGYTGLHQLVSMAQARGHEAVAEFLQANAPSENATDPHDDVMAELHRAIKSGNEDTALSLLTSHRELVAKPNKEGLSALHLAVRCRRLSVINWIVQHDLVHDNQDNDGFRPIHYAYWLKAFWHPQKDARDIASLLLTNGARDSITLACARGDRDAVHRLLAQDASLCNDGDSLEKRPLSTAAEFGHEDLVAILIEHGADPCASESQMCPNGYALFAAVRMGYESIARQLLAAGAPPNQGMDSSGITRDHAKTQSMKDLLASYGVDTRPDIWAACQAGDMSVMRAAMAERHDPFDHADAEYNRYGWTAVISGCAGASRDDKDARPFWDMFDEFRKRNLPLPDTITECRGYMFKTPAMTKLLLEDGLNPNLPNWLQQTPLHDFCEHGIRGLSDDDFLALITMFIEAGADVNAIEEQYQSTPMGFAARSGFLAGIKRLLEAGADPTLAGASWATPLHWAKRQGHADVEAYLTTQR